VRELRAANVGAPILLYTAVEADWYEAAALDAGADDYLLKKTPIPTLLARLNAHLCRHEREAGVSRAACQFVGDPAPPTSNGPGMAEATSQIMPTQEALDVVWRDSLRRSPAALSAALSRGSPDTKARSVGQGLRSGGDPGGAGGEQQVLRRRDSR